LKNDSPLSAIPKVASQINCGNRTRDVRLWHIADVPPIPAEIREEVRGRPASEGAPALSAIDPSEKFQQQLTVE
jgi:hypothetical protein